MLLHALVSTVLNNYSVKVYNAMIPVTCLQNTQTQNLSVAFFELKSIKSCCNVYKY